MPHQPHQLTSQNLAGPSNQFFLFFESSRIHPSFKSPRRGKVPVCNINGPDDNTQLAWLPLCQDAFCYFRPRAGLGKVPQVFQRTAIGGSRREPNFVSGPARPSKTKRIEQAPPPPSCPGALQQQRITSLPQTLTRHHPDFSRGGKYEGRSHAPLPLLIFFYKWWRAPSGMMWMDSSTMCRASVVVW